MLRHTINKYRRLRKFASHLSGNGKFQFILLDLLGIEKTIEVAINGTPIFLRTATPDIKVVFSSLVQKEYADIELDNVRLIVDAGANIGTSAIYFANRFPNATVVSLEPEDENFALLSRNTRQLTNVKPIKAAIWGSRGSREIRNRHTGAWGYTVSETDDASDTLGQQTDCITIDDILEQTGASEIDILKLDIEGGEKDVLENSSSWVGKVRVLSVELHDRICMGCSRAFYLATRDFSHFDKYGEKVTAYRETPSEG